jgi:hypothetical protein
MPLYGRAFTNTAGLGQPYKGLGAGTWEAGVYDFKDLPLAGATEYWDQVAYATYSYDNATGMLVSYDTLDLALTKVDFIKQNKLGGAMWWEVSGDRNDSGSIISGVSRARTLMIFLIGRYNGLTKHTGCQRIIRRRRAGHRVEAQLAILPRLILLGRKKRIHLIPSSHINLPAQWYSAVQGKTHFRNNRWEMENGAFKIRGVHARKNPNVLKRLKM